MLPVLYPGVEITPAENGLVEQLMSARNAAMVTLRLRSPGWIDLPKDVEPQSVNAIIHTIARQSGSGLTLVQLLLDPIWMTTEDGKQPAFRMAGRIVVASSNGYDPGLKAQVVASSFGQLAGFNGIRLSSPRHATSGNLAGALERRPPYRFVPLASPITPAQVARVYHPPENTTHHDSLVTARCFRAPSAAPEGEIPLGEGRNGRGRSVPLHLQTKDLLRHAFVLGPTGSGKTTLLANLARELAGAGHGVTVLDPHGSLVGDIARTLPREAEGRGALIRFSDTEHPVGLNPMRSRDGRDFVAADELVEVVERVYGREYWGPLIDLTLRHAAMATIEIGGSIVDSARLLDDSSFRERVLTRIENPETARVLEQLGDGLDRRILPAINRLQRLVAVPWLRNIVGQTQGGLDFGAVFDRREIALFDLSGIGATNARLLGSLILLLIRQATLSRSTSNGARHFVLVDEASWFLSRTVSELFDQARKFGVGIILATQRVGQLIPESVRESVLSNSGALLTFRVGSREEAIVLERHFASDRIGSEDLRHLPRFEAYLQLTRDGDRLEPAWLRATPPALESDGAANREAQLIDAARRRYGRPRVVVEAELRARDEARSYDDEPEVREVATTRAAISSYAA